MSFDYQDRCESGVYVLLCEDNRYYVGASSRIQKRLTEHFNGEGVPWTQKYAPLEILKYEEYPTNWKYLEKRENTLTIKLMRNVGWRRVRGGRWMHVDLQNKPKRALEEDERPEPPSTPDMENLQQIADNLL